MANRFDDTDTLPLSGPPATNRWQTDNAGTGTDEVQRDRFRLGRELARDFEDMATSTGPLPQGNGDYTDTLGSFDIGGDANATSTRKLPPGVPSRYRDEYVPGQSMLHHSPPTIDIDGLQGHFADFTMAADHRADDTDSYEIGRGRRDGQADSLLNNTTDFFSMNPASTRLERGRPDLTHEQSLAGVPSKSNVRSRKTHAPMYGSPLQKSQIPSLEFSVSTTPKRNSGKASASHHAAEQPSKIMDVVSSAGSAGSGSKARRSPLSRDSEEDALSEINGQQKRLRPSVTKNLRKSSLQTTTKQRTMDEEKSGSVGRARKSKTAASIPKAFKSTSDFLKELGVDGHTQTINLQSKLGDLKSTNGPSSRNLVSAPSKSVEYSFAIPKLPDMTDLFSANDVTLFSTKQGAATSSHIPIESIPIPHDSRALLAAMKLLEKKVDRLEHARASNQQMCTRLEDDLRRAENRHQVRQHTRRKQAADTTFDATEDVDAQERAHEKENIQWMMEKLKMETHITSLRRNIDQVSQQLEEAQNCLKVFQDDHQAAISSVAAAIASQEDLKAANLDLERQLARSKQDQQQAEHMASKQRREFEVMESKLRKRARDARDAATAAEEAMLDAARRELEAKRAIHKLQSGEPGHSSESRGRRKPRDVRVEEGSDEHFRQQQSREEFDEQVRKELLRIRPDLFRDRASPVTIPHGVNSQSSDSDGLRRVIAVPKSRKSHKSTAASDMLHEILSTSRDDERGIAADSAAPDAEAEATKFTLSPDEVRKLRKDIHAERYGRKTAPLSNLKCDVKNPDPASESSARRPRNRRVVKVVYLVDDDHTEILKLEKELEGDGRDISPTSSIECKESGIITTTMNESPGKDNMHSPGPSVRFAEHPIDTDEPNPQNLPHAGPSTTSGSSTHDISHEGHDPEECTVCIRYSRLRHQQQTQDEDNPIAGIDASMIMPAPELNPGSRREAAFSDAADGDCTMRPSADPQLQLERVVKQLKDEFRHLKLVYHGKSDAFSRLDPSVGWRRRKALTTELNELVAEMGAKADQIYALYDVKEEFAERKAPGGVVVENEGTEDLLHILGSGC